jgi:hypothetical protein
MPQFRDSCCHHSRIRQSLRSWFKRANWEADEAENTAKNRRFKPLTPGGRSVLLHPVSVGRRPRFSGVSRVGFFILGLVHELDLARILGSALLS